MTSRRKWGKPDNPRELMSGGGGGTEVGRRHHEYETSRPVQQQFSRKSNTEHDRKRNTPSAMRGTPHDAPDPKQLEYIRKLERKNRLKKLEQAGDTKQVQLEKGFNVHFSGANQDKRASSRDGHRSRGGVSSRGGGNSRDGHRRCV